MVEAYRNFQSSLRLYLPRRKIMISVYICADLVRYLIVRTEGACVLVTNILLRLNLKCFSHTHISVGEAKLATCYAAMYA